MAALLLVLGGMLEIIGPVCVLLGFYPPRPPCCSYSVVGAIRHFYARARRCALVLLDEGDSVAHRRLHPRHPRRGRPEAAGLATATKVRI
jgi:hypothetical protein